MGEVEGTLIWVIRGKVGVKNGGNLIDEFKVYF